MILFTISYQSKALHKQTTINVLLPQEARQEPFPVLWTLHGMTNDNNEWLRHSLIENEAEKHGVCVVMPNADLSFYTNMAYGADYLTFLGEELPGFLRQFLPISDQKKDQFLAGTSMGGYGAFLTAMRYPDHYQAAFSLSGPMKISWIYRVLSDPALVDVFARAGEEERHRYVQQLSETEGIPQLLINSLMESGDITRIFQAMFGTSPRLDGSDLDLFQLSRQLKRTGQPLQLIAFCGEQDYHYESNLLFRDHAVREGLSYTLFTGQGAHNWDYWNQQVPRVFDLLGKTV